jgi:hypothetical protein
MNTRTTRGVLDVTAGFALTLALGLGLGACTKPAGSDTPRRTTQTDGPGPGVRAAAVPGEYTIRFDRPLAVGQRFKVVATGRVDSDTAVNGRPMAAQSVRMTYAIEGIVTVKAVHTCGKATREELKIVRLQMTKGGATRELLPAGTVVLAVAVGSDEKFTVNGTPVSKDADKVLGFAVSLFSGDTTTTDDVFGPGALKKPGDSWKPNAVRMLASLKAKFKNAALWPKPADVTGKVTFVAAKKVNDMDVLEIAAKVRLNNLAPRMGKVKATSGYLEIGMSGWLPTDPKVVNHDYHVMTMKMHIEGEMTRGPNVIKLVVDYDQSEKKTVTPIH